MQCHAAYSLGNIKGRSPGQGKIGPSSLAEVDVSLKTERPKAGEVERLAHGHVAGGVDGSIVALIAAEDKGKLVGGSGGDGARGHDSRGRGPSVSEDALHFADLADAAIAVIHSLQAVAGKAVAPGPARVGRGASLAESQRCVASKPAGAVVQKEVKGILRRHLGEVREVGREQIGNKGCDLAVGGLSIGDAADFEVAQIRGFCVVRGRSDDSYRVLHLDGDIVPANVGSEIIRRRRGAAH